MMSTENKYTKGTRVWIPHQNKVWESAIILEDYDVNQNKLFVQGDNSRETKILEIKSPTELPPLYICEEGSIDIKSNLSTLAVIHEATILQKLRERFEQRYCYSYSGISMIALNPFYQSSENETDTISNYQNSNLRNLDAHVFGFAESVYRKLERENCDQTIVFTGESAAGKTVNAERAILYLTTISSKEVQIKEKILASSVILQAFGHATTSVNNNSSRFGRFIQMQYDKNYHIIGALLTLYNLDRSKIVSQGPCESFYNIFYYMYAVKEHFSHLQLNGCQFNYLKRKPDTEAYDYDAQNREYFDNTIKAFHSLGFSEKDQNEILNILAILLHLQSITFKKIGGREISKNIESCTIEDISHLKTLGKVSDLGENMINIMRKWMCYKRIFWDQDEILQPMNLDQAVKARDALAKFIYTKMFNWLLTRINASFRSPCHVQSFIGILDMPGFERLDSNSFEQFCINYIDEKVQQLSIQLHFKLEQEEYEREEIGWTPVRFSDNLSCVELIDGKFGILDLLEEETKMSSDNNLPWFENLNTKFNDHQNFEKSTQSIANFIIHHFIRSVQYNATDFLAKNYGNVAKEQLEVLSEIKNDVLNKIVIDELSKLNITKLNVTKVKRKSLVNRRSSVSSKSTKKTVTTELRTSLAVLLASLSKTKISFVRCIKSNDEKKSFTFDSQRVHEQLRAFEVYETTNISAAGYFQQRTFKEFFLRYHCLSGFKDTKGDDKREICEKILAAYKKSDVRFGKTKVFLREDTIDCLESQRAEKRQNASLAIQRSVRRFLQQKRYNEIRRSIYGIQHYARGYLSQRQIPATKIQACFRGYLDRRWLQFVKRKLPVPRAYKTQASQDFGEFYLHDMAATAIQKHVKRFLARRRYELSLTQIIIVQSIVRRFLATMMVKKLKHQKNLRTSVLNKSVEKKFDYLQERIDCLLSMNLSPEDRESVDSIVDNQTCIQTKNKILNELLFKKIKCLQNLCGNEKPCEIQHSQPAVDNNVNQNGGVHWRAFDKPIEKYDNKELNLMLFDSFQKADRDAKTLQHTTAIEDTELIKLMKSYRNSLKTSTTAKTPTVNTVNKYHSTDVQVCKERGQKKKVHCAPDQNQSSSRPIQTLDTKDLQALSPYSFSRFNYRPEEKLDSDKKDGQRLNKKSYQIKIFYLEIEASNEPTEELEVKSKNSNQCSSQKVSRSQAPKLSLTYEEMLERKLIAEEKLRSMISPEEKLARELRAERRFQLIMRGVGDTLFNELSTDEVAYDGMFAFDLKTTASVIYHLTDVRPAIFLEYDLSPDLPAQILMMCIRYADHKNDYGAALSLLHNFIKRVRFIVEAYGLLDVSIFWLSNTFHLLNYLKQYSKPGKETYELDQYHAYNNDRKNQQRLRNIDIRETWVTLEQTSTYLANRIIKEIKSGDMAVHSVIALLYSESICVTEKKTDNAANNVQGAEGARNVQDVKPKVDILLDELTVYYDGIVKYSVDRRIVQQIFKAIFDFISSVTLSNLLSPGNLWSASTIIQIRHNLRALERWAVDRKLATLITVLKPIIQAVQFFQMQPMSENDIMYIRRRYNKLSGSQMLRIVELYNYYCCMEIPTSCLQVAVSPKVMHMLKLKLEHHEDLDDTILLDQEEYPIVFPFRYSRIRLEEVEIPQRMNLPMLKKI